MLEYGFVRVGASSLNLRVGDVFFNQKEIVRVIKEANKKEIAILVFPELSITGYTAADLFLNDTLLEQSLIGMEQILKSTSKLDIISIIGCPLKIDNQLFNTAFVISRGHILGIIPKTYIPNYGEFYEKRWFAPSSNLNSNSVYVLGQEVPVGANLLFRDKTRNDVCFGVEICEDLWAVTSPSDSLAKSGATLIFNLSSSNEVIGKYQYRKNLVSVKSSLTMTGYIYASSGINESTTDLVFSGHTMIYENGTLLAEGERFKLDSDLIYNDVDVQRLANLRRRNTSFMGVKADFSYRYIDVVVRKSKELVRKYERFPFVPASDTEKLLRCKEILDIQAAGLCKRLLHIGIKKTVIGISGGLDSTLAFLVILECYKKLGISNDNLIAITMPGFGTTNRTLDNSIKLMKSYEVDIRSIDIKESCLKHFEDISYDKDIYDVTYENVQARERTQILMDVANKEGAIVIGTGDLSELILGWCTYNGDHMSMYAVNSSIPKTLVKDLVKSIAFTQGEEQRKILMDIVDTPISPELLPTDNGKIKQKTEDTIGPYELHDFFTYHFLRYGAGVKKIYYIACKTFDGIYTKAEIKKWLRVFIVRFFQQQFKRNCLPDGVKVGTISVSPRGDLRMPSDASYKIFLEELERLDETRDVE